MIFKLSEENMSKRVIFYIVLFSICFFNMVEAQEFRSANPPETVTTTVFLVRHAEKIDDSRDPELTPAGKERARALAYVLSDVKLDAVYDTPFIRTRDTAKPTADSQGLEVETIHALRLAEIKTFVEQALEKHKGGKILFVSHSNVVPGLIKIIKNEELTVARSEYMNDQSYDDLFVVSFETRDNVRILNLKYGKSTPKK